MKFEKSTFAPISTQVNSLNLDQLELLSQVYEQLNIQFNFFMSQETYQSFINICFETSTKHQPDTFKSLINLLTSYTYEHRYPHLLLTIDLIKKDYTLSNIINTVYHLR